MPGHGRISAQSNQAPSPGRQGVGHGFLGREGLGGDDEESLCRIQIPGGFGEVRAVHVGDETDHQIPHDVGPKGLESHDRSQIGSADADVHHIADGLAREALPGPGAHLLSKGREAV